MVEAGRPVAGASSIVRKESTDFRAVGLVSICSGSRRGYDMVVGGKLS